MTPRILSTAALIFSCYFTIGLQLGVVPRLVHVDLGFSALLAGLAISAQYVATLASRPLAGRVSDRMGPKRTTLTGLVIASGSSVLLALVAALHVYPLVSLWALLACRLLLGVGESCVATGSTLWGMGRVGAANTARVISWSGIASYGALAVGAPCGIWLQDSVGLVAVACAGLVATLVALAWAIKVAPTPVVTGEDVRFTRMAEHIVPYGVSLALGGIGFGTIASFITLYYANRHWPDAGLSLSLFGAAFVAARLLFSSTIDKWGGYRVAIASLTVESCGLILLWAAWTPGMAHAGAALSGLGFSLVFPALGVEAVRQVPAHNRGSALGLYTAFVDLSLGLSGPIAGVILSALGYSAIFLVAAALAAGSAALALVMYLWHERLGLLVRRPV